ncbi:MAG: hypothetical protein AAF714_00430 [Pseudomonadota bacterium]
MSEKEWWEKKGELSAALEKLKTDPSASRDDPGLPPPEDLIRSGITTGSTLDHRSTIEPTYEPEPTPDDPEGWETARRKAIEARDAEIARDREEFEGRADIMKSEFNDKGRGHGSIER